jgi:hypothetical protein
MLKGTISIKESYAPIRPSATKASSHLHATMKASKFMVVGNGRNVNGSLNESLINHALTDNPTAVFEVPRELLYPGCKTFD